MQRYDSLYPKGYELVQNMQKYAELFRNMHAHNMDSEQEKPGLDKGKTKERQY